MINIPRFFSEYQLWFILEIIVIAKFVECKTPCALQDFSWQQDISSLDSGPGTWELGNFSRGPKKAAANFSRNGHCPTSHDVIFAMWKTMRYTSYTMYVFFFHGGPAFFPPCILFFKTLPLFLNLQKPLLETHVTSWFAGPMGNLLLALAFTLGPDQ